MDGTDPADGDGELADPEDASDPARQTESGADGGPRNAADGGVGIETDGGTEYEAVFWDIGGVILDIDSVKRGHYRFLERLVDEFDAEVSIGEAVDAWRTAVGDHFREREGTEFRSALAGYEKGVAAVLGESQPRAAWIPLFREAASGALESNPGVEAALADLDAMDVHLGVVSDADRSEAERILETFGVRRHFDSLTISEDVGRTKPDPAMFEAALAASEADPERSIMIGDRYEHDMAGAKRFDMTTIAHGAEDGEAVDYRVDDLREVVEIVRGER